MEIEKIKEHIDMLNYFWEEKGKIERYCHFEEIKPFLEKEYPEILKAWSDYNTSIKTLDAVLRNANNELYLK